MKWFICILFLFSQFLTAEDNVATPQNHDKKLEETTHITQHTVMIEGKKIPYEATVGNLLVKNDKGTDLANFYYIAYRRTDVDDSTARPITFCFNGGPGSSSVWLHMGAFGPKRIATDDWGTPKRPVQIVENPYSILDKTDLVFVDPVSTGFSRAAPGEDPKQFHGVTGDIESVAKFIRLYTSKYQRWLSPKYLAGESYGTMRAAGLALQLLDEHNLQLDGLFLMSCILNFQPYAFDKGNDLAYITFLPTYTATAWYHKKLAPELQQNFQKTVEQSIAFANGEYSQALIQGDKLTKEQKKNIASKLSSFTGLDVQFIEKNNLRVGIWYFTKQLLNQEGKIVGRFDSRLEGLDEDPALPWPSFDPSVEEIFGPVTAAFNDYVCRELHCQRQEEYMILSDLSRNWDYGDAKNKYFNISDDLKKVMTKNPHMHVLVSSGYYDLATPFYATDYTLNHLQLHPEIQDHIHHTFYEAGHMMYLHIPSLIKLRKDFIELLDQKK